MFENVLFGLMLPFNTVLRRLCSRPWQVWCCSPEKVSQLQPNGWLKEFYAERWLSAPAFHERYLQWTASVCIIHKHHIYAIRRNWGWLYKLGEIVLYPTWMIIINITKRNGIKLLICRIPLHFVMVIVKLSQWILGAVWVLEFCVVHLYSKAPSCLESTVLFLYR